MADNNHALECPSAGGAGVGCWGAGGAGGNGGVVAIECGKRITPKVDVHDCKKPAGGVAARCRKWMTLSDSTGMIRAIFHSGGVISAYVEVRSAADPNWCGAPGWSTGVVAGMSRPHPSDSTYTVHLDLADDGFERPVGCPPAAIHLDVVDLSRADAAQIMTALSTDIANANK